MYFRKHNNYDNLRPEVLHLDKLEIPSGGQLHNMSTENIQGEQEMIKLDLQIVSEGHMMQIINCT